MKLGTKKLRCDKPYDLDEARKQKGLPRRRRNDSRTTAYQLTIRVPEEYRTYFDGKKKLTHVVFALNKKEDLKDQVEAFEDAKNAELERALEVRGWTRAGDGKAKPGECMTPLGSYIERYIEIRSNGSVTDAVVKHERLFLKYIDEAIGEQKLVQAFGHETQTLAAFDEVNERLRDCSLKATFFSSLTNPCTRFVNSLVYAAVGFSGALAAVNGCLTIGGLSSFLSYANQYTKPFNDISDVMTEFQNALACAQRVFDFIDETPILPDAPDAVELPHGAGAVEFEHVKFRYVLDVPLIEDMNLKVEPGQRIALVGPTGCGKTTLVNLLMRFYEVNGGTLRVDGRPIDTVTRDSLRGNLGMVLQETWLKAGTIAENIAYGKPDATREEIIAAAKKARAHSFICRLPNGYDTEVAEDGGNISQGQRQLLCIARVMLRRPPILILDEATSSIDTRTEVLVQDAFEELMKGRTSFIVAHRLSTIKNADQILVMKDGNIIERGTHDELLDRGGFYAKLYESQFAKA